MVNPNPFCDGARFEPRLAYLYTQCACRGLGLPPFKVFDKVSLRQNITSKTHSSATSRDTTDRGAASASCLPLDAHFQLSLKASRTLQPGKSLLGLDVKADAPAYYWASGSVCKNRENEKITCLQAPPAVQMEKLHRALGCRVAQIQACSFKED